MSESAANAAVPSLSVIVVTYNSVEVVPECLSALDTSVLEVIVVDNASTDGTADVVEARFPEVRVIRNTENGGFAEGVHLGASHASGAALTLLNPDAVASTDVLTELARRLQSRPELGAIAPLIEQPDGRLRIVSAGWMPTVWRMFTHYSGISRLGRYWKALEGHYLLPNQLRACRSVEWATGACLIVTSDAWRRTGGLTRRWFMYAEDIELCWRIGLQGMRIEVHPDLTVTHLVGGSETGHQEKINSAWVTTLYDFYATDLSSGAVSRGLWRAIVASGLLTRSLIYLIASRGRQGAWKMEARRFRIHARETWRAGRAWKMTS